MILIFGGAYQGKREFAGQLIRKRRGESAAELRVFDCAAGASDEPGASGTPDISGASAVLSSADIPDFSADIICGLEHFTWTCCTENPQDRVEASDWMRSHRRLWQDKCLIITDVSQGIVPTDARTRAFREMNGRLMLQLASEADEVWRVFCGIGKQIK